MKRTSVTLRIATMLIAATCFMVLGAPCAQAQTTIAPAANPAHVVVMGDSLIFNVTVSSKQAWPAGELKATLPAGFRLLPSTPGLVAGSLSGDGLTGRISAPVTANGSLALKLFVKPLCDAETAVVASDRKIAYVFYGAAGGTGTPVTSVTSDPISNFYNPILNVVYPDGQDAILYTPVTRVIEITQTASFSHANALRINATADKNGITVSKLEVSRDGANWTDVTAAALDASQTDKYVYKFTRANTFAPLAYPNSRMQTDAKLYIRETVTLKKCDAGFIEYSVSYGDGVTFCDPLPAAAGNSNLAVSTPAFGTDILNVPTGSGTTWPKSPSIDGIWHVRIFNTSTDPNAVMKDIYLTFGIGSQYFLKKAYICKSDGSLMPGPGGANDTIWLALSPGTGTRNINIDFESATAAAKTIYDNIGFIDSDGDGKHNDLNINKIVDIKIIFNITLPTNCPSSLIPGISTTGWGYYKFCDQYVQFGRAYGGGGASWYHGGLQTSEIRNTALTPAVVRIGDKATLSFLRYEHANTNFLDALHGATGTSTYWTDISLPAGLDFDDTATSPVVLKDINGNTYSTGGDLTMASGYIQKIDAQHIRVRILPDLHGDGTWMNIAVKANGTSDPTGKFTFFNEFDYGNTGTFLCFGRHTPAVTYVLADNCGDIETTGFTVERTSLGYVSPTNLTTIAKANANTSVIYPFDNVTLATQLSVRGASTIDATTTLKASASYKSDGSGTGEAYFNKRNENGELRFFRNGTLLHTLNILAADVMQSATTADGVHMQKLETDIAKPLRTAGITSLQTGDSIAFVIYARATEKLPNTNDKSARPVTSTLSRNGNTVCYPLIDEKVKFVRYTFDLVLTDNTDGATSWQERNQSASSDLFYGFNKNYGGINLLKNNEYRPNVDNFSNIIFVYDGLIKVNRIRLILANSLTGNETSRTLATGEYTVNYGAGKTTVTVNPLKDHMFTGQSSSSWVGYYLYVDWDAINMTDNFASSKTVTFSTREYPTSATPVQRTYSKTIGTDHAGGIRDFYKIKVTSSSPVQLPTSAIVEWPLSIENNSAWVSANSVLPYTWIAFETPAGITPSKLIDVTSGNTIVADIASSGFLSYGSGYYWVKLGNVSCPTPHNYRLQCTYTVCDGTPSLNVRAGMSKLDYPQDPANSFAQSPYNSQGMAIHASSSVGLSFTPPVVDYSGLLVHRPHTSDGTNEFCDTTGFRAEFHNGLRTEVSRLQLHIPLPDGFDYDPTLPATVKFGNGAWQNVEKVTQTDQDLIIQLDSAKTLAPYETSGDKAYVDFRLRITCGAENKRQIYADFIGQSGCGAQISKRYNSGQVKIAGMAEMPDYWIQNLTATPPPVIYTSATAPTNGELRITGQYRLASATGEANMLALIELPPNLDLATVNGGLVFTQDGTRLKAELPATDVVGDIRTFDFTLAPVNPHLWNEDSVTVFVRIGRENIKSCDEVECTVMDTKDISDSIRFAMTMLDIRFSDTVTARGSYYDNTTERVVIEGWLANDGDYDAGELTMELLHFDGTTYVPASGAQAGLTVTAVPGHDSTAFTVTALVPYTENVCNLALVLRKTGVGASNPWLADSVLFELPAPKYEITQQPDSICQMDEHTPVGDPAIQGYTYQWNALATPHLSSLTAMPGDFSYDYLNAPVPNNTTLAFLVTITRPDGCQSVDTVFIPLKGIPSALLPPDTTLCNGSPLHIEFTDPTNTEPHPTIFSWTITGDAGTGLPASGSGSVVDVTALTNSGTHPLTVQVNVTPAKNGCNGVTRTFNITVSPTPQMNDISDRTVCSGGNVATTTFETIITGTTVEYEWTATGNWVAVGLPSATGSGNIPAFTANANTGGQPVIATITVTPKIGDCAGSPKSFTVTVNPAPRVNQVDNITVCSGGSVTATHFGTVITSPTVTYTWTATNHTLVGLPSATGTGDISAFTASVNTGTVPVNSVVTVTPKIGDCTGTPESFTITVNPVPQVNAVSDITVCSASPIAATDFTTPITGVGVTYEWNATNHAAVGLPSSSGTGGIASFTAAANPGATAVSATITVTPKIGDCTGTSKTFTITINPTATVNSVSDREYFRTQVVPEIVFTSPESPVSFNWTNSNPDIGLSGNGSGKLPQFTATNTTTVPIEGVITVTPLYGGSCPGTPISFKIKVKPNPTITYHYDGGDPPNPNNPNNYTYGVPLTISKEPTRSGYTFEGWICDELGITTPAKTVTIPAGENRNLNFYADWGLDQYDIHYYNCTNPGNPVHYTVETNDFTLQSPTRTGYTFAGWTGSNGTTPELSVTITKGSTGDLDYTAHWTPVTYSITFEWNGGVPSHPSPMPYTIEDTPLTLTNPAKTGYDFVGWTGTDLSGTVENVTIPAGSIGDRSYTAVWSEVTYSISYTLNSGTNSSSNPGEYRVTSPNITLQPPVRTGYTFTGWTGSNGATPQTDVIILTGSSGAKNYEAHWMRNTYTLNYTLATPNSNGNGTVSPPNPATYHVDTTLITLTNPTHPGYTFTGWSGTDVTGIQIAVTIPAGSTDNRSYTAHWELKAENDFDIQYTLTTPNGDAGTVSPSNPVTYNIESNPITLTNPTHPGYAFTGWEGTDLTGIANMLVSIPTGTTGNREYTAHWSAPISFNIGYNLDGGTVSPPTANPTTYNVESTPITLVNPTRGSDTFVGWTGTGLSGKPLTVTIPTGSTGDRNYTAHWPRKLDDLNGGVNDTLYACEAPRTLYGDPTANLWTWICPDGNLLTTRNISATMSGRYICRADYGSIVVPDTLHVYFLADVNTHINYITTTGAKIGKLQQFVVHLPEEVLSKATLTWTVNDGGSIVSATDTLTAIWITTGEKYVFLQLGMNHGALTCTKTLAYRIRITERGLGLFVDRSVADGLQDGSSWANAFRTVDEALKIATPGDRIWVAKGIYYPEINKGSFVIQQDSIEIYGGFSGNEEYLYERNTLINPTILRGDGQHPTVTVNGCAGIRIDGFTIENGRADNGAGVLFDGGSTGTLANDIIKSNVATGRGGGVYASAPWYDYDGLTMINTEVSGNQAVVGAGVYNEGSRMRMLNATISGNQATAQGGGLYNIGSNPQILNTIIWDNLALHGNASNTDVHNAGGSPRYVNSVIGGSRGSREWATELGIDGGGNRDENPLFLYRGVENDNVTLRNGNYHLSANSVAVDGGNTYSVVKNVFTPWDVWLLDPRASWVEGLPMDLDYNERIANDDMVDIGAYEHNSRSLNLNDLDREVILPAVSGVATNPGAGVHYVQSRANFVFTVTPSIRYAGQMLVVTTSRTRISDREGVNITKNADDSYLVTIYAIQDRTNVYISFGWDINADSKSVSNVNIWSYKSELHVRTTQEASTLRIYNLAGQLLHQQPLPAGETVLPLPQGVYAVSLDDSGMRQKVVIK